MVAAAVVGAGVLGAVGSTVAGSEQAGAANNATATQLQMYNRTRQDLSPFVGAGTSAIGQLTALLGISGGGPQAASALAQYPGYQFAMDQGVQALDRSAASKGLLLSGGQLRDITTFGQGLASTQYQNAVNNISGLATLGENAAAGTGQIGSSLAQGAASSQLAAGQAQASGIAGATNQIGGILTNQSVLAALSGTTPIDAVSSGLNSGYGIGNAGYSNVVTGPSWVDPTINSADFGIPAIAA